MYENSTYEKNGETKTVRKPLKKEITVTLKELVLVLEETLKSFLLHAGNIAHQYQMMTQLNLSTNEVLIHIDFSENYYCKYREEIQAVHFGGGRQQVTLHTGVLYLKNPDDTVKTQSFCTLSDNSRHDLIAVWAHLKPIFDWFKNQRPNIHTVHMLSDSPVNQYKNKFVFHIVSHHLKYFLPGINNFTWNYSEPGHGKGAPDGVGGTLKRSADQAVAEGKDVTDLNVLKNILSSKCPSIMLIEVSTAEINDTDNLIKKSKSISTFPGTQKIRQFVSSNDVLEFKTLSCFDCVGKFQHFHLVYYKTFEVSGKDTPAVSTRRKRQEAKVESNVKISKITPSEKIAYGHKVGDQVLITWNNEVYPGKILSLSDDGALVRCMKKGSKCWKWPTVNDEELYAWADVLQIIKPPKLIEVVILLKKSMRENENFKKVKITKDNCN
ncbi:unnamed protein product [Euphydryas editha]|uniref:SH3 domain-containing protein n=1 Tax=Euphydryas editha TaxID=104508 RepID=A0AAU9U4B4_EUPED|nr:unnamed protein product [Euphydryas editha]